MSVYEDLKNMVGDLVQPLAIIQTASWKADELPPEKMAEFMGYIYPNSVRAFESLRKIESYLGLDSPEHEEMIKRLNRGERPTEQEIEAVYAVGKDRFNSIFIEKA